MQGGSPPILSNIRSRIFTKPIRSAVPARPWRNAASFLCRGGTSPQLGPALMANFWAGYAWPTVITAVEVVIVVVPLLLPIAMLTYTEPQGLAFSQLRNGPNVVGPF